MEPSQKERRPSRKRKNRPAPYSRPEKGKSEKRPGSDLIYPPPTAETTSNPPRVKWPRGTLPGMRTRLCEMQTAGEWRGRNPDSTTINSLQIFSRAKP